MFLHGSVSMRRNRLLRFPRQHNRRRDRNLPGSHISQVTMTRSAGQPCRAAREQCGQLSHLHNNRRALRSEC
jgi:hypothetical protein